MAEVDDNDMQNFMPIGSPQNSSRLTGQAVEEWTAYWNWRMQALSVSILSKAEFWHKSLGHRRKSYWQIPLL